MYLCAYDDRVYEEFPLISHDLTEIRRLALTRLSKQFDEYNQSVIDEAIEVYSNINSTKIAE
jgi:hypothetical protein